MMADGRADYMVQATCTQIVRTWSPKRTFYMELRGGYIYFPGKQLALLSRGYQKPRQVAFQPQRGITSVLKIGKNIFP